MFATGYLKGSEMSLRINDTAPDFTANSTEGTINFHDWLGDSYALVFSHPRDFTPVCTTEFGAVAQLAPEFEKRGTKVVGVSVEFGRGSRQMEERHCRLRRRAGEFRHHRRYRSDRRQGL